MPKDYYVVLGIPRSESPEGVRRAFRDLARQHHPDRAGPSGTPAFRELVEAYRVLSDPGRRRAHDASLEPSAGRATRPDAGRAPAPARWDHRFDPRSLLSQPSALRPSADALVDRILRNFLAHDLEKAEHAEPLFCDVRLSPSEALRGGILPVRMPIAAPCPACHGAAHRAGFPCGTCDADGRVPGEIVVPVEIPPGVRTGAVLETSLAHWGIRNLWLRARIRVAE